MAHKSIEDLQVLIRMKLYIIIDKNCLDNNNMMNKWILWVWNIVTYRKWHNPRRIRCENIICYDQSLVYGSVLRYFSTFWLLFKCLDSRHYVHHLCSQWIKISNIVCRENNMNFTWKCCCMLIKFFSTLFGNVYLINQTKYNTTQKHVRSYELKWEWYVYAWQDRSQG